MYWALCAHVISCQSRSRKYIISMSRSSKPILSYGCLAGTCHCPLLFFLVTSQALFKDSTESFGPCALKVNTVLVAKLYLLYTVARGTDVPGARSTTIY